MWRDSVLAGGGARGPPGRIRRKLVGSNQYEAVQAGNETVLAASIHDVSEWLMSGGSGHHLEEQPSLGAAPPRGHANEMPRYALSPRLVRNTVKRSVTHHIQSDAKASQRPSISHGSYSSMDSGDTRQPLMWNSVWLRRIVLLGFSLGCCCMTLTTALLYHFSLENNGLSTQKQANHLGWKYGPTACEFFPPPANE
ncbi:hypothetical protein BN1723_009857 [Verticillium longisporum]|uniref:Uncharacterized protein n=1 Tax=Verticillium longisporum TaxID=100787 RepID=A0A0G4KT93_VERLO|nr:hypothetical protein BN1723_009857 [Verticillium longisporum]